MQVRLIVDIHEENDPAKPVLVAAGTVFEWSEARDHQWIDGEFIYVDRHEVEEVL